MINHEHRLVFIHIPKCAGTSIEAALGHSVGEELRRTQDHRSLRMLERPIPWAAAMSSTENIKELLRRTRHRLQNHANARNALTLTAEQYRTYFKFTVVRNPWARAYSWYKNVKSDPMQRRNLGLPADIEFGQFLRRCVGTGMLKSQLYWLRDFSGAIPLDFVGRFERLQEDFSEVCLRVGLEAVELPHKIRSSGNNDYVSAYDDALRALVAERYREEIEYFGYQFE